MPPIAPKALLFDVFGTCVDWRGSVTDALVKAAEEALGKGNSISNDIRSKASKMSREDWGGFAQEWRTSYLKFTRGIAADPSLKWRTVDEHYQASLKELLAARDLLVFAAGAAPDSSTVEPGSLFTEPQLHDLHLVWHRLTPWADTNDGLRALNSKFTTVTLTNGNLALVRDLVAFGEMPFADVFSSEMFQSYKPSPKVYLGAAEKLGLKAEECALVAAHLDDIRGAQAVGFKAVYVERPQEERHLELRSEIVPDVWIKEDERGFVAAAEQLGCNVTR